MTATKKATQKTKELDVDYEGRDLEAMSFTPRYSKWIISMFAEYVGDSILEVGAGCGNFTRVLIEEFPGKDLTVLEPSQQFDKLQSNEIIKGHVKTYLKGTLAENLDKVKGVDTVIYNNVMEHIEDDQEELNTLFEMLPTGGHVIVFSPAIPALMSEFDRSVGHFRRYMKKELDTKFKNAGFDISKSHYVDIVGILPWYLKYTMLKGTLSPNDAKLYDSVAVPVLSVLEPSRLLPIGKNILTIGVKR